MGLTYYKLYANISNVSRSSDCDTYINKRSERMAEKKSKSLLERFLEGSRGQIFFGKHLPEAEETKEEKKKAETGAEVFIKHSIFPAIDHNAARSW